MADPRYCVHSLFYHARHIAEPHAVLHGQGQAAGQRPGAAGNEIRRFGGHAARTNPRTHDDQHQAAGKRIPGASRHGTPGSLQKPPFQSQAGSKKRGQRGKLVQADGGCAETIRLESIGKRFRRQATAFRRHVASQGRTSAGRQIQGKPESRSRTRYDHHQSELCFQ